MASTTAPLQHLPSIPYSDPPSRLRTLDIWLPRTAIQEPPSSSSPSPPLPWLIYLHGGAWRDPLETATTALTPTLHHLHASHPTTLPHLAGIASLNYRLSPYPSHPTHPSHPADPDRSVTHPQHLRDVACALRYLAREHGVTRWIGVGHSCGATMLLQFVAGMGREEEEEAESYTPTPGPEALLLLAGIYSVPVLLRNHAVPVCSEDVARVYEAIVVGAFGAEAAVYAGVSPVAGRYGREVWGEGRLVVMGHSYEDELVERAQRDVMCVALDREGWSIVMEEGDEEDEVRVAGRRVLNVRDLKGSHDFVWQDGRQIAQLIAEIVQRLS